MAPVRRPFTQPLIAKVNADAPEKRKGMADAVDFVPTPDGEGAVTRWGTEIHGRYHEETDPLGRVAYITDTPPGRSDGAKVLLAIDTVNRGAVGAVVCKPSDGADLTPISEFSLSASEYSANLGEMVVFTVYRTGLLNAVSQSVTLSVGDGTAVSGTDYAATSQTLTFAAGERSKTVTMQTYSLGQGADLWAVVKLSNPSAGTRLGDPARAIVNLDHDDFDFAPLMHGGTGGLVLGYSRGAGLFTAYKLAGFPASVSSTGFRVSRVGTNALHVLCGVVNGSDYDVYSLIYDLEAMREAGGFYGGGSPTISPESSTQLGTFTANEFLRFVVAPSRGGEIAFAAQNGYCAVQNIASGAVAATTFDTTLGGTYGSTTFPGSHTYSLRALDTGGRLVLTLLTNTTARVIGRLNPRTGIFADTEVADAYSYAGGFDDLMPMADNRLLMITNDGKMVVYNETLETETEMHASGVPQGDYPPVNANNEVIAYSGANFYKYTVGASSASLDIQYGSGAWAGVTSEHYPFWLDANKWGYIYDSATDLRIVDKTAGTKTDLAITERYAGSIAGVNIRILDPFFYAGRFIAAAQVVS